MAPSSNALPEGDEGLPARFGRAHCFFQIMTIASFPCLILAWILFALGEMLPRSSGSAIGPVYTAVVVLLMLPAIIFWSRSADDGVAFLPWLRRIAIVAGVGALCVARLDLVMPGPSSGLRPLPAGVSLILLAPAGFEWARALRSMVTFREWRIALLDLVVVVVLPLAFLFAAPIQRFMEPGWVDPAMYLGLALDYFDMVRIYGWNYHALRVSFVVPNIIAHSILPPEAARMLVMAAFHLLGLFGLYSGVRKIWSRRAAAVAVASLAYNPVYLKAMTGGYVDAAVLGYMLALFGALAAWLRSGHLGWIVLGGALTMLTVLAHSIAAAPAILILMFFLVLRWEAILGRAVLVIGSGFFGAVCAWLFFVYSLSSIGFGIDAFQSLRWMVTASVNGIGANYRHSLSDWLPAATRLLPGLMVSWALLLLAASPARRSFERRDWAALVLAITTIGLLPVYDLSFGGSATQAAFYSGFILPGIAIATGALAALLLPADSRAGWAWAAVITLISILVTGFAPSLWWLANGTWFSLRLEMLCMMGGTLAALLLWARINTPMGRGILLSVILGVQSLALAVNRDTRIVFRPHGAVNQVEFFRASIFIRDRIRAAQLDGRRPLFWFERGAFATRDGRSAEIARPLRFGEQIFVLTAYDSFASLRLWDRGIFLPNLVPGQEIDAAALQRAIGTSLVVLAQDSAMLDEARATLARSRVECHIRLVTDHQSPSFVLHMAVIDVLGVAGSGEAAGC